MSISDDWSGEPNKGRTTDDTGDDFNPNDPDVVKVHYDLTGWTIDQRAELSEALADADVPHGWDGDELIVPDQIEDKVDELFERLEAEIGPFPVLLGAEDESTEFGLDEWPARDREVLTEAVIDAQIPHRWDGTTILVARDAETEVDELLDAIESGELISLGEHGEPPEGAMSTLYLSADRLARDPRDKSAGNDLTEMYEQLDERAIPYGITQRTWRSSLSAAGEIVEQLSGDDDADESDIIGAAQKLRSALRPYV